MGLSSSGDCPARTISALCANRKQEVDN